MVLNPKLIGRRIRSIRKMRKLTQAELAERTGLSVPYISHIENGIKQASLQAIVNIAEILDCTADNFLYENRANRHDIWQLELAEILSDCTVIEQHFLFETLGAIKHCISISREIFECPPPTVNE